MTKTGTRTVAERIVGASIVVGIAHACLKFTGLIQSIAAASFLETSEYEPIFVVAFSGVIFNLFLIGEEVVGPSFLPVFMQEMDERGEQQAWDFTNILMTIHLLILLVLALSIFCFPDFFIRLLTEWKESVDPERYALLRQSLRYLAPCLIFLSLGSTTYMILNGYKRFFLAAFGDASWKICVALALVVGMGIFKMDYRALFFGLIVGSIAKLLTHLCGLIPKLRYIRPRLDFRSPALRTMGILVLPLLFGILFARFRDVFNNVYVLTHIREVDGLLQANDLGRKLFAAISWMVPYALQIALFPFLCELVDRQDRQELGKVLTHSCRLLLSVFIPASLLLVVLSEPIAMVIFFRGRMDFQVAIWTGITTACYLLVLPAAAVECVLMQGYFANRRMVSVTVIGVLSSALSVLLSWFFIVHLEVKAFPALLAVALGFVLSRTIKSLVLALYLKRSIPMFPVASTGWFLLRVTLVGIAVAGVTYGSWWALGQVVSDGLPEAKALLAEHSLAVSEDLVQPEYTGLVRTPRLMLKLSLAGMFGGLSYFGLSWIFRLQEPFDMFRWLFAKLRGRFPGKLRK